MPDFDLFLEPFLTGLLLALMLPLLGAYLRLRNEWLAALSLPHVAAAGALLGALAGGLPLLGGLLAALLACLGKPVLARRLSGDAGYAVLLVGGWALGILIAANHPLAERLGHALFDGQIYFAGRTQLLQVLLGVLVVLAGLWWLSPRLLLARLYPALSDLRGTPAWPLQLGFDLLGALALTLATMNLGVLASFTLVFVPPWAAFRRARSWRAGCLLAVLLGGCAYLVAFALALAVDQPFGAVFALLQIVLGLIVA